MWFSWAYTYAQRGMPVEHKISRMILWSVIMALSMNSILGTTTANYDTTTTNIRNSTPQDDTRNVTATGYGTTALPLASSRNPSTADSENASSSVGYLLANTTAPSFLSNCLSQGKFYCQSGGTCINSSWRCDGYSDCLYNEDELGCTPRTSTSVPTTSSARDSCLRQGRFYCQSGGTCISSSWRCDGVYDCLYNEDELGCTPTTSTSVPTTSSARDSCLRQGRFYCQSGGTCISSSWRCDGVYDCLYNEDELGCTTITSTSRSTVASSSCGGTLYGSGYVRSPNYPSYYDNNLSCNWTFIASSSNGSIALHFDDFYTQSCCDFLSIYNRSGTLINRYSGGYYPSWLILGNGTYISFTTDSYSVYSGFSIYFVTTDASSSCGGTRYGSGYVQSPNFPSYYGNSLRCNWTLIASPYNGYIVLQFNSFYTYYDDFLSIYNSNGSFIHRYSGSNYPSTILLDHTAFIVFNTDSYTRYSEYTGFLLSFNTSVLSPRQSCEGQGNFYCALSYECVDMSSRCTGYNTCTYGEDEAGCSTSTLATTTASSSSCGGTLYGSGYIRSPNYPSSYNNNLRCNWTLVASSYYGNVVLQFLALETESCCDFVTVYHSNGTLASRYSGTTIPSPIILGSYAVVSFSTDSSVVSSGFSIWFSTSVAATTTLSPRDSCEQQGYFYCGLSNLCIALWRRCDGYTYCYYGEDESGCSSSSTTRTPAVTTSQRDSCLGQGNFYCEFSRECIGMWSRCDGYAYCYYGEDESGCGSTTTTSGPFSNRPSASDQPRGSFIAASGVAQAFLQLGKSSASSLPRGRGILVSGYITALLLGICRVSQ